MIRQGELIEDAAQVYDLLESAAPEVPAWIVLICKQGPRGHTVMVVDNAPLEGLTDVVATVREARERSGAPFTGIYVSHHAEGRLTFPDYIDLEDS